MAACRTFGNDHRDVEWNELESVDDMIKVASKSRWKLDVYPETPDDFDEVVGGIDEHSNARQESEGDFSITRYTTLSGDNWTINVHMPKFDTDVMEWRKSCSS